MVSVKTSHYVYLVLSLTVIGMISIFQLFKISERLTRPSLIPYLYEIPQLSPVNHCLFRQQVDDTIIDNNNSNCCHILQYANIGTIYNCSQSNINKIGIMSMHVQSKGGKRSSWIMDTQRILSNHKAYTRKNNYIYFEITSYTNPQLFDGLNSFNKLEVLLMKPYLIHKVLTENSNLQYLVWVDLDTLFFNCSSKLENVLINKSKMLYDYCADIIFSYEPTTVANTGVVVYSNTIWTKQFLQRMIQMTRKFAKYVNLIHGGWADQNIFIASVMGYNDRKYNYSNETHQYLKYLMSDIRYGNEPAATNQTWDWLGDNYMSKILHQSLDNEIQKHVSLLSPFDMNFGFRYYNDKYSKSQLPHQPFIIHFAGPPSKPFISTSKNHAKLVNEPLCVNITKLKCTDVHNYKGRLNNSV
eukprot:36190_1